MQRQQPFTPEQFQAIYSQVPRLAVEVLVTDPAWGVLLITRQEPSWQGQWHIPGGTVFYKEPLELAVPRIAAEELGITVQMGPLLGYLEYPSEEQARGFGWTVGLVFDCKAIEVLETSQTRRFFTEVPDNTIGEQRPLLQQVLDNMSHTLKVKG